MAKAATSGRRAGGGGKRAVARISARELEAAARLDDSGDEDAAEIARVTAALSAPLPEPEPEPEDEEDEDAAIVSALDGDVDAPPDLPERDGSASAFPAAAAAPMPPVLRHQISVVYRPDAKRHMSELGLVSTQNWIGRCRGQRVSVRYGAPLSTIPHCVRVMLAEAGIRFGYAPPPVGGAATAKEPPRARRGNGNNPERGGDRPRPFRAVRGLQSRP